MVADQSLRPAEVLIIRLKLLRENATMHLHELASSNPLKLVIAATSPALALLGAFVGGVPSALIFGVVGINVSITSEILRRQLLRPLDVVVKENEPEIVSTYLNMVEQADSICLYTWVGSYSTSRVDAAMQAMERLIASKGNQFRMTRLYNPQSPNWTPARIAAHQALMRGPIQDGKYRLAPTTLKAFEIGFIDYIGSTGARHYRAALNFLQDDGTPYVAVCFDSGVDPRHERVTRAIRRIFESYDEKSPSG